MASSLPILPQGQPQALDALVQPSAVSLDPLHQDRELTPAEAREAFESLFCDFIRRRMNQGIFDAAKGTR